MKPRILVSAVLTILCVAAVCFGQKNSVDPELERLRHEWAMRYMEPGPHMELAKYFRDKGNLIQGFFILETARRYRFDETTFDAAFLRHFGGFAPLDNSKSAEAEYLALVKGSPNDAKLLSHLADMYISRNEYVRGEPYLRRVFEINPQDFSTLMALDELYDRLGTPAKGAKLISEFETAYPNSAGAYHLRLSRASAAGRQPDRQILDEALAKYPDEGFFWYVRGTLARVAKDLDQAEASFVKAATLDRNSQTFNAAAASFFRVERNDPKRAIEYYIKVYFLNPHAHFDGHAEAKVTSLNYPASEAFVDNWISEGKKADDLLADPNPDVVGAALSRIAKNWDSSKTDLLLQMVRHDDVTVRYRIPRILVPKEGRKLDERVKEMLNDSDLRVRGVAAYMAVELWRNKSFVEMRKMLQEQAQILRYDAYSALIMYGGAEGRRIVRQRILTERNVELRKVIQAVLQNDGAASRGQKRFTSKD